MLSAGKSLVRLGRTVPALKRALHTSSPQNSSNWVYRSPPVHPSIVNLRLAELAGATLWFWVFYRFLNDWEVFTNEWPRPDASKFTDAELGIPPEGED